MPGAGRLPTFGVEVELAVFKPSEPVGDQSTLPGRLLQAARRDYRTLPSRDRDGCFTCAGLVYREMHRFLEAATWPAASLGAALRAEDTVLELVRRLAGPIGDQGYAVACYPDDLQGSAVPLRPTIDTLSSSMGTHVNLFLRGSAVEAHDVFTLLATVLPEVVGPGGFVRNPHDARLEFWRDPRSAHVGGFRGHSAHERCRPVIKQTDRPERVQIVSLGWTGGRIDRVIKYGLLMLLASFLDKCLHRSGKPPRHRIADAGGALHAAPGARVAWHKSGRLRSSPRLEILEFLLDEILEPESETAEGSELGCSDAVHWARAAIAALRGSGHPSDVARAVPLTWALKQNTFQLIAEESGGLPVWQGLGKSSPLRCDEAVLHQCAVAAILEANILDDPTRAMLVDLVDDAPWSYADVYGADPDAALAVDEQRPPAGAIAPAAGVCKELMTAGEQEGAPHKCAHWTGVEDGLRGAARAAELARRMARLRQRAGLEPAAGLAGGELPF